MQCKEEEITVPMKRKRVVLTLEQKLDVIKLKDEGKTFYEIASRYNIGISTIKDLLKKRELINEAVQKNKGLGYSRKTLREGNFPDVENRLYEWVNEKLEQDEIVTNNFLLIKAREITRDMKQIEWKPSKGWLSKFKQRYNLTVLKEELSGDQSAIQYEESYKIESEIEEYEGEEVLEEEKPETLEVYTYPVEPQKITPVEAADRLLEYVIANKFPLKEIITLRMIRDKVIELQDSPIGKDQE